MKKIEFESPKLWHDLSFHLSYVNRYILNDRLKKFIGTLLISAKKREHSIEKDTIYYRARLDHHNKVPPGKAVERQYALSRKKMINPPSEKAKEGRVNPKGISCLYLSSEITTAIAETRPWIDELVSVARCKIEKNLRVVSLISDSKYVTICSPWEEKASPEEKENRIWHDIRYWFSRPITIHETSVDYVATQYLSELFKESGYDGIIYPSSLSEEGHNLALFDSINVKIRQKVCLHRINRITYNFDKHKNY